MPEAVSKCSISKSALICLRSRKVKILTTEYIEYFKDSAKASIKCQNLSLTQISDRDKRRLPKGTFCKGLYLRFGPVAPFFYFICYFNSVV